MPALTRGMVDRLDNIDSILSSPAWSYLKSPKDDASQFSITPYYVEEVLRILKQDWPKSATATAVAGHIVFDANEEGAKMCSYINAVRGVLRMASRKRSPYINPSCLIFLNIRLGTLDLATGTTTAVPDAAGIAYMGALVSHQQQQQMEPRDPRFLRPLEASILADFRAEKAPNEPPRLGPDFSKKPFTSSSTIGGPSPLYENIVERSHDGHRIIGCLRGWVTIVTRDDFTIVDEKSVNPIWEFDICYDDERQSTKNRWWFYFSAREAVDASGATHRTVYMSDLRGWPVDGRISIAELRCIIIMMRVARIRIKRGVQKKHHYLPLTLVSTSSHLCRVIQAWYDHRDPVKLNIRISPVMSFQGDLKDSKDWDKTVRYLNGTPVAEE